MNKLVLVLVGAFFMPMSYLCAQTLLPWAEPDKSSASYQQCMATMIAEFEPSACDPKASDYMRGARCGRYKGNIDDIAEKYKLYPLVSHNLHETDGSTSGAAIGKGDIYTLNFNDKPNPGEYYLSTCSSNEEVAIVNSIAKGLPPPSRVDEESPEGQKLLKNQALLISNSSVPSAKKVPQTVSVGPVSVTLTPTSNTSSKCYEIAYENRGDKNVDIFIKLTLTNNKTGEKGTSVWLGDNTQFDGLFGSANTNKLNPKTQMDATRTGMYNNWLMAKNFIFNNQPSDLFGFNNTVESCDDITAEIPSGGLKWNENAYQRHYDACSSSIKSNRPVGC